MGIERDLAFGLSKKSYWNVPDWHEGHFNSSLPSKQSRWPSHCTSLSMHKPLLHWNSCSAQGTIRNTGEVLGSHNCFLVIFSFKDFFLYASGNWILVNNEVKLDKKIYRKKLWRKDFYWLATHLRECYHNLFHQYYRSNRWLHRTLAMLRCILFDHIEIPHLNKYHCHLFFKCLLSPQYALMYFDELKNENETNERKEK